MQSALLDTHTLIWLLNGSDKLGQQARALIEHAAQENVLYVSAISPWEIAMLVSKQRLSLERDVGLWLQDALALPGIKLQALLPEISVASTRLPGQLHPDPADRIIVATARHLNAVLITDDSLLLEYSRAGHVKTFKASA